MKKIRPFLLFALFFSLVFSCVSAERAIASHGNSSDYFYELLSDGTVQIMHCRGHATHLTVPAEIEGCPVTVIDTSAFSGKQELQEVVLPDTLRHLEDGAFSDCTTLRELILPEGLLSIGLNALPDQTGSGRIVIPRSVLFLENQYGPKGQDPQVRLMTAEAAKGERADESGQYLYRLLEDGSAEITLYTGTDTAVSVPDTLDGHAVTRIGGLAFMNQRSLESITLPQGIVQIGSFAFKSCTALLSAAIPEGVTHLGNGVFSDCFSLRTVSLPASLVQMGANPFASCQQLEEILIPYENERYYFAENLLLDLENLSIVAGLNGNGAFETVYIPEGVRSIGPVAFVNHRLTYAALPDGLESIGILAFEGLSMPEFYVFPDSLTSIGYEGIPTFPSKTIFASQGSFGHAWALEGGIFIDWAEASDAAGFGYALLEDGTAQITSCHSDAEIVVIPQTIDGHPVSCIGELAFCLNDTLKVVVIPEGVVSIGAGAFDRCSALLCPELPQSLRSIGEQAFAHCESLQLLTLPAGLESIADDAFLETPDDCRLYAQEGTYAYDWAMRVYSE